MRRAVTVRTRLALWFAALFLAAGAVLIAGMVYSAQKYMFADHGISSEDWQAVQEAERTGGGGAAKALEAERRKRVLQQLRADATKHLLQDAAVGLSTVTMAAGLVGAVMSGRLLRRVRRVTAAARMASDTNLRLRLNLPGPRDEIKELGDTFDAMLGRLAAGIQAQQRFVANASHELRTPLAVARTTVEVTLAKPRATVEQLRAMGEEARESMIRAQRLVDSLLLLARSEQETGHAELDDLGDIVADSVDQIMAEARRGGLSVHCDLQPAPVTGDLALLTRAVANLLENAVRHNHDGGEVRVATGGDGDRVWAEVANTGPDLTTMDTGRLFEPFHRGARTRLDGDGAGLGLSIVAAVVRAHGGTVTAKARPAGGGLTVRLEFPATL